MVVGSAFARARGNRVESRERGVDEVFERADSIKDNAVNIIIATVMGVIAFAE